MADIEQEIGELKATVRFAIDSLLELKKSVEKNNEAAADFRDHVTEKLAVIETTGQNTIYSLAEYKKKCDDDHDDSDGRLAKLENWRSNQAGRTTIMIAVYGAVAAIAGTISAHWSSFANLFKPT